MKLHRNAAGVFFLAALMVTSAFAQSGSDLFKSKCAPCHGVDGLAATPAGKALKAASFKDPSIVKKSDADLIAIVKNGKGKMPAWTGKLTDDQIKATVAYLRTLQK